MPTELSEKVKESLKKALSDKVERRHELEAMLSDPELASKSGQYAEVAREHGELNIFQHVYDELIKAESEKKEAKEFAKDAGEDPEMQDFAAKELEKALQKEKEVYDDAVGLLCSDLEHKSRNVMMEIRSGAGGQEASLFASDLLRMYTYYAQKKGWKVRVMDRSLTDLGGIKHITIEIKGKNVWQHLQYESGGHRVQRVPETESQGRIHTSLATVAVLPQAKQVDVELNPDDLEFECMRSQGPGGQSVNKVNSCVRITHKPTGIAVKCQEEKSQHKNRKQALELLRTKLYDIKLEKQKKERDELRRDQIGSGDRNERIRTYNIPQDRVTDHRVNMDVFGVDKVLMGDLDEMIARLQEHDKEMMLEKLVKEETACEPVA